MATSHTDDDAANSSRHCNSDDSLIAGLERLRVTDKQLDGSGLQPKCSSGSMDFPPVFEQDSNESLIGQSVFNQILMLLPGMIEQQLANATIDQSPPQSLEFVQTEMRKIKSKQVDLENKLNGHKKQVETWKTKVNNLEMNINEQQNAIDTLTQEANGNFNPENETELRTLLNKNLKEIKNMKNNLNAQLDELKAERDSIKEIDKSQKFIAKKYDEFAEKQTSMNNDVTEIKKKVEKQETKTEHMFTYSRMDHVTFVGVPYCYGPDGTENCKRMIVDICRELYYNIPINEISTAHRLKQYRGKTVGESSPPGIIVRFKDRDIRNDVLDLKSQLKGKTYWSCYNITKLYINEQLTPDKRKLMYETKVFTREMYRIHGRISVWTYKGNIFIRKSVPKAPKRKIRSKEDLDDIRKGTLTIDPISSHETTTRIENRVVPNAPAAATTEPFSATLSNFPLLGGTS